jgi:hypothetical protein
MSGYTINFSNTTTNGSISIAPGYIDRTSTSLDLLGPNAPSYGSTVAQNFLKLLENFSNSVAPANPVEGQLWYDTSNSSAKVLRILDASNWQPINGIYQQAEIPTRAKLGDVWVNTITMQIKICSGPGPTWVTIGTDFTQGNQTGFDNTVLRGVDGVDHSVILSYLNGEVITILAKEIFKPQAIIEGFDNLIPGLNFSSKTFDSTIAKVFGIATEAAALRVTLPVAQTVSANNFLRKDIPQSLTESLTIDNNSGLKIGTTNPTFLLQKTGNDGNIFSTSPGSKIRFTITDPNGVPQNLITVDGNTPGKIGIGAGNIAPEYTLDVLGTMRVTGATTLTSSLIIGKELTAKSTATITGPLLVSGTSTFSGNISSRSIVPLDDFSNIGASGSRFDTVYATTIDASDTINGNATSASRLFTSTNFSVTGHIASPTVSFNGDGTTGVTFNTTATYKIISEQVTTSTVGGLYNLVVLDNTNLYKVTKTNFLADITPGLLSSGMIIPWAGDLVPSGWLLCNGASYTQSGTYNSLFSVIGIKYGSTAPGTFQVPNLTPMVATGPVSINYIIRI